MVKAEIRHDMIADDIISNVFEDETKKLIRALRGTGREDAAVRYIKRVYPYVAQLELELFERDLIISQLKKENKKHNDHLAEHPARPTIRRIYDRRKRHSGS